VDSFIRGDKLKNYESLRVPKYIQLMVDLRRQIEEGSLKPGNPLPTREKMMATYGLSLSTVTRSITELERQGWLISRQGSGTFIQKRPENSDQNTQGDRLAGLLIPVDRPGVQDLVVELVHEAQEQGINVLTMYTSDNEEQELNQARVLFEKGVRAIVWFPIGTKRHVSVASLFGKHQIPVIIGDRVTDRLIAPWSCVRCDYYGGTASAMKLLLDQGHKKIVYVGPDGSDVDFGPACERWNAYKDIMLENNLWNPDELVFHQSVFREWHIHSFRVESLFRQTNPTALIGYDDVIALEAIKHLGTMGHRVPGDIAAIGHGDMPQGQYSSPRLTTVSPCLTEYVDELVRILKNVMTAEPHSSQLDSRETVVPQRLIVRDTVQTEDETVAAG